MARHDRRPMRISVSVPLLGVVLGLALSCTTDDGEGDSGAVYPEACDAIIDACHTKDDGSDDAISSCHSAAHDADVDECNARLEECVALCDAAPPVGGGETGYESTGGEPMTSEGGGSTTGDATADGSTGTGEASACVAHCECMTTTCSASEGYPYATEQDCLDACAGFSDEELGCFGMWCEAAAISPDPLHLCEHAWGSVGTSKC